MCLLLNHLYLYKSIVVGESGVRPFGENGRRLGTLIVSGREQFSSFIRRSFSPKHEATNQQDRPSWAVFFCIILA